MGVLYPGNPVFFNDFDLSAVPGLIIETIDPGNPPKRVLEGARLARAHGSALISGFYESRSIVVSGRFARNSQTLYEQVRDTILAAIQGIKGTLRTDVAGAQRLFNCTLDDSTITEHSGGTAKLNLYFTAHNPFSYDSGYTIPSGSSSTGADKDFSITFGGTAPIQYPIFTLTFTAISGSSSSTAITLTNKATGQATTITGLLVAGDVLTIDTEAGEVLKNGVPVEFSGALPFAAPGLTYFSYHDSGLTARTVSITTSCRKRYL